MEISPYYNEERMRAESAAGRHRDLVGGHWEEIGLWQFELMTHLGLKPGHRLLDVGCGAFRGGVRFVELLEPGDYFGIDLSAPLVEAGYRREIEAKGLAAKLPRANLHITSDFECAHFGGGFDFALALSVFTHLPLNNIRLCLERVGAQLKPGGAFIYTYFHCPDDALISNPIRHEPGGITTYPASNPYHYKLADLEFMTRGLPLALSAVAFKTHPRDQRVLRATRT